MSLDDEELRQAIIEAGKMLRAAGALQVPTTIEEDEDEGA